jgi:hypothetical protein
MYQDRQVRSETLLKKPPPLAVCPQEAVRLRRCAGSTDGVEKVGILEFLLRLMKKVYSDEPGSC